MILGKKRSKNPEFGIIITDKRKGLYITRLMKLVMENSKRPAEASVMMDLEPGDVVVFDTPKNGSAKIVLVDYRKVGSVGDKYDNIPLYDLVEDFGKVERAVRTYFAAVPKQPEPKTLLEALLLSDVEDDDGFDFEMLVVNEPRRRRTRTQKRDRRLGWNQQTLNGKSVDIYEYWVKVGTNSYDIFVDDETGDEFIRINNSKVYVDRTNPNYPYLYTE